MQDLQGAFLVADGRELVRALEGILGFLRGWEGECGALSLSRCRRSSHAAAAGVSSGARRRRAGELSRGAAPQPCAPPAAVPGARHVLSLVESSGACFWAGRRART
jgi:hypothetical protein